MRSGMTPRTSIAVSFMRESPCGSFPAPERSFPTDHLQVASTGYILPFASEHLIISPVGFKGHLSPLDIFLKLEASNFKICDLSCNLLLESGRERERSFLFFFFFLLFFLTNTAHSRWWLMVSTGDLVFLTRNLLGQPQGNTRRYVGGCPRALTVK